ncbi:hypothetical protein H1C71_021103 [Ictidomys tridecemlineatus]|nr:hypothetical protein H1C71_021103 [Ictidomys tridecemlineatus]
MLGQATIEERYKVMTKDITHSVQMSWNLAPKYQLLLSNPDVARTSQSPLKPHLDDKNKNKKAGSPFSHIAQRKQAGRGMVVLSGHLSVSQALLVRARLLLSQDRTNAREGISPDSVWTLGTVLWPSLNCCGSGAYLE